MTSMPCHCNRLKWFELQFGVKRLIVKTRLRFAIAIIDLAVVFTCCWHILIDKIDLLFLSFNILIFL